MKQSAGANATWDKEILLLETPAHDAVLSCKVVDHEHFAPHRTLAKAWLDLSELKSGVPKDMDLHLAPKGVVSCTVTFTAL